MKKLVACIIETRPIHDLENIIRNHMGFLPEETDLHIWVGEETKYLVVLVKVAFLFGKYLLIIKQITDLVNVSQ